MMPTEAMKVGALARRTGISVRTLHYYDEIGLLSPSAHSEGGHRLYTAADIARLQQIKSLRQLGFSLEQTRECLSRPDYSPQQVIAAHLARLREQIALQERLCASLEAIARWLASAETVSVEHFLYAIERTNMAEKYYTPEQLEYLEQRREIVGETRIREVEAEWPKLMAEVRAEMEKGTDPSDPRVQALAARWQGLVREFTGGDPGVAQSMKAMYEREKPQDIHPSIPPDVLTMYAYIAQAMKGTAAK
jgi:DNA-binding transcriptional MerR regulator